MTTYTLALHPATDGFGAHDPSAVLFADGTLVFGVEEGRLVGRKGAPNTFPTRAVRACLAHAGVELGAVDRVLVPWDGRVDTPPDAGVTTRDRARLERRLAHVGRVPPLGFLNHHRSHAASAFGPSGFEEALVLTLDGRGARDSTVVWHGHEDGLERIARYPAPNSLGYLYAAAASYLGFEPFGGEGKLMGLAPYGEPAPGVDARLRTLVETGVDYDVTDLVGAGIPSAVDRFESLFDQPRRTTPAAPGGWAAAFARSVQGLLEEIVTSVCVAYCERLGVDRLCLAGGVALNCALNGRLAALPAVDQLFVQPVAGDPGAPLGAALAAGVVDDVPRTLYWGPAAPSETVARLLDRRGRPYTTPPDLAGTVARRLADGALVGWFQGRQEMGPRALGARSVLADPRTVDSRARVNAFVKGRAPWRPFAPSLTATAASEFLRAPATAPYMIRTFETREDRRGELSAVVHPADGTTRPQIVRRRDNPRFHRLLRRFGQITGVPALLNTSFNAGGEPLVTTPAAALDLFSRSGLDLLVLEDHLLEKPSRGGQ